jgi:hypothetical protein
MFVYRSTYNFSRDTQYQLSLIAVLADCTAGTCTLSVRHSWQTMCCLSLIILGFFEPFTLRRFVTLFQLTKIFITNQCCGSLVLMENCTILQLKNSYFWSKIENTVFSPRPPWRTSKLQEKPPAFKKRTSSTSKQLFFYFFLYFFCLLGSGSSRPKVMRIRISNSVKSKCDSWQSWTIHSKRWNACLKFLKVSLV